MTLTKSVVLKTLKSWGLRKTFKPYLADDGVEAWLLLVRRPAHIVDGALRGGEVWIDFRSKVFRVWTSQRTLARAVAGGHGLKVRLLDGEAEVFIPAALADDLLPRFGAKVKREMAPEQKAALKARLASVR